MPQKRTLSIPALSLALLAAACNAESTWSRSEATESLYETSESWGLPSGSLQFGPAPNDSSFSGNGASPGSLPTGLLVPLQYQERGSWCGVASVQMVASYYGLVTDQCRLADLRDGYPEGTCCATPTDPGCDHGTPTTPMIRMLAGLGLYGAVSPEPLSENELRDEIINGRPVIITEAASSYSHALVAFGYDPGSVDGPATFAVNDPASGFRKLSYEELRSDYWSGAGVTTGSYYRLAPSPDGCNRGFDATCGGR